MNNNHLLIDIGNTAIDCLYLTDTEGIYEKHPLLKKDRLIESIISNNLNSPFDAYLSSVNLEASAFLKAIFDEKKIHYRFLDSKIMEEFSKENGYIIPNVSYLGADLFSDIIAKPNPNGLIIIDLGTATKILYLDKDGLFHGSSILPGIRSFPSALFQNTSLLGKYPLMKDPPLVSLKTEECISSGAILGTAYAIKGMIEEILKKNPKADIYLTGGDSPFVEDHIHIDGKNIIKDPYLVLEGIAKAFGIGEIRNIRMRGESK